MLEGQQPAENYFIPTRSQGVDHDKPASRAWAKWLNSVSISHNPDSEPLQLGPHPVAQHPLQQRRRQPCAPPRSCRHAHIILFHSMQDGSSQSGSTFFARGPTFKLHLVLFLPLAIKEDCESNTANHLVEAHLREASFCHFVSSLHALKLTTCWTVHRLL